MTDNQNISFLDRLGDSLEDAANRDLRGTRRPVLQRPAVRLAGAALAATGVVAATGLLRPTVSIASVEIRTEDGFIVAEIEDLEADSEELRAAFLQYGLDITVTLEPASPTFVGRVTGVQADGVDQRALLHLEETCEQFRACTSIGLRIPLDYAGKATIHLGRPAKADEAYVVTTDSFTRGEALHCSDLLGATTAAALAWLGERGLTADWRVHEGDRDVAVDDDAVEGMWVHAAVAISPSTVVIWAAPDQPAPQDPEYLEVINEGC